MMDNDNDDDNNDNGDIDEVNMRFELMEQMEEMKKALKKNNLTEKQIKDIIRPHYKNIKELRNSF